MDQPPETIRRALGFVRENVPQVLPTYEYHEGQRLEAIDTMPQHAGYALEGWRPNPQRLVFDDENVLNTITYFATGERVNIPESPLDFFRDEMKRNAARRKEMQEEKNYWDRIRQVQALTENIENPVPRPLTKEQKKQKELKKKAFKRLW